MIFVIARPAKQAEAISLLEIASSYSYESNTLLAIRLCHNDKNTVIARAEGPKQSLSPSEIASSLTSFAPRNDENTNCDTVSMTVGL